MKDLPGFSVVVPTYNRRPILERCLTALAAQDYPADRFEVLVVDDGSTDGTSRWLASISPPFRLRALRQENQGQGIARNLAVRQARRDLVLFLGDDIFLGPGGLREHGLWHRRYGGEPEGKVAVLGRIDWARELRVNSFMNWINEYGLQFGYALISDPMDVPFNFFYTSNLSVPRGELVEAGLFDPAFRSYGWEDIELGYRLARRGLKILYNPAAAAEHHHLTTFASFVRRQRQAGRTAALFHELHPELGEFLGIPAAAGPPPPAWQRRSWDILCRLMERLPRAPWPALYDRALREHYLDGLRETRGGNAAG